jgi:hypothetical protein
MFSSITIISMFTSLTVEALGIKETFQTFSTVSVTAAWHIGINVTITQTRLACTPGDQWVTIVIICTLVTTISCIRDRNKIYITFKTM